MQRDQAKTFPRISSRAFEHATDKASLAALRKVPGFDMMLRRFIGLIGEKSLRTIYLAGAVKVSTKQFSHIDDIFTECVDILDMDERPELFVAQTPFVNAGAIGTERPFIVLNSGTIELMNDDELRFIIGHELGHILADHTLYKTMLKLLLRMTVFRYGVPLSWVVLTGVIMALNEWDRKSELTSDRAGLLCLQDTDIAFGALMKMAGGTQAKQMNVDEFIKQAEEYRSGGDKLDSFYKLLNLMGQTHPFPVLRLSELKSWADEGSYTSILGGDFPTRDDDQETPIYSEFRESARAYRKSFEESDDPAIQFLRDLGKGMTETGGKLLDNLRDVLGRS